MKTGCAVIGLMNTLMGRLCCSVSAGDERQGLDGAERQAQGPGNRTRGLQVGFGDFSELVQGLDLC